MDKTRILIIDDDRTLAESTAEGLEVAGHHCEIALSGTEGLAKMEASDYDVIVTDLVLKDINGLDVVRNARRRANPPEVIVVTGYPAEETALEALDEGAYDYLSKPFHIAPLRVKIRKALEKQHLVRSNVELRRQIDKRFGFEGIVGSSKPMQDIFDTLRQISDTTATVLITGESGTGKELIARAIHNNSSRRNKHFVPLNCAALSESILESELFGHEKGAFTGATYQRKGRFEFASGGTLFLDEIGDLPPATQVKLLRVIEYGEISRVGSNDVISVDVRLVAATNKRLEQLIADGKFREDLYFRLKVVTVDIPPLRERPGDIPLLIESFVRELSQVHRKTIAGVDEEAREIIASYPWPGNVRELRNCIESMVVVSRDEILNVDDLPRHILQQTPVIAAPSGISGGTMEEAERDIIRATLDKTDGNREQAAKILGIGERTLYRKIKQYGLS